MHTPCYAKRDSFRYRPLGSQILHGRGLKPFESRAAVALTNANVLPSQEAVVRWSCFAPRFQLHRSHQALTPSSTGITALQSGQVRWLTISVILATVRLICLSTRAYQVGGIWRSSCKREKLGNGKRRRA